MNAEHQEDTDLIKHKAGYLSQRELQLKHTRTHNLHQFGRLIQDTKVITVS